MSAHAHPSLTPEEYLEMERAAEFKSEYYNGRMYAIAGAPTAVMISGTLPANCARLQEGPCGVTASDLRVRVSPRGLYTYPEVVVVCGEPKFADDQKDTLLNPTFIAEVLSPSTEAYDRGFK